MLPGVVDKRRAPSANQMNASSVRKSVEIQKTRTDDGGSGKKLAGLYGLDFTSEANVADNRHINYIEQTKLTPQRGKVAENSNTEKLFLVNAKSGGEHKDIPILVYKAKCEDPANGSVKKMCSDAKSLATTTPAKTMIAKLPKSSDRRIIGKSDEVLVM